MSVRRFFIFILFLLPLLSYGQSRRLGKARLTKSFDYVALAHELTDHPRNENTVP